MTKKVLLGAVFGLVALPFALLRYGFVPLNATEYSAPSSRFERWDEVFKTAGEFTLTPWQTGRGEVDHRRKFLDKDTATSKGYPDSNKPVPVWAYYLTHPRWGALLIDTGYDRSFSGPEHGNYILAARWYTALTHTRHLQNPGQSLDEHLAHVPARPTKVFFTHAHFDHTAGLPALSGEEPLVFGDGELDFASRALSGHFLRRFSHIQTLDSEKGRAMPPFEKAVDLFGDGSFWAVRTTGHTPGHLSYLVMTTDGPVFITGDACMYYDALEQGIGSFSQYPWSKAANRESMRQIRAFKEKYPQVRFFVAHDDLENQPRPGRLQP